MAIMQQLLDLFGGYMAEQTTLSFAPTPPATKQRRSYTREEKLDILSTKRMTCTGPVSDLISIKKMYFAGPNKRKRSRKVKEHEGNLLSAG